MKELPTLKIGCGEELSISTCKNDKHVSELVPCGQRGKLFPKRVTPWYCADCGVLARLVLPVVLAHAAKYNSDCMRALKEQEDALIDYKNQMDAIRKVERSVGARDAVLKLAGLKDLEED